MTEPRQIAVVDSDDDLSAVCRRQAVALGVTYGTLDRYTAFTTDFWSKKLAISAYSSTGKRGTKRGWSGEAFQAALVAFCFDLVAVENPQKVAKLKAWMEKNLENPGNRNYMRTADAHGAVVLKFSRKHMKKLSKLATEGRKKIPLWKRRALARKAGRARWRRTAQTQCVAAES